LAVCEHLLIRCITFKYTCDSSVMANWDGGKCCSVCRHPNWPAWGELRVVG